jgi:hypothetical protein
MKVIKGGNEEQNIKGGCDSSVTEGKLQKVLIKDINKIKYFCFVFLLNQITFDQLAIIRQTNVRQTNETNILLLSFNIHIELITYL